MNSIHSDPTSTRQLRRNKKIYKNILCKFYVFVKLYFLPIATIESYYNKSYFLVPSKHKTFTNYNSFNYNKSYFLVPSKRSLIKFFKDCIITNLIFLSLQNSKTRGILSRINYNKSYFLVPSKPPNANTLFFCYYNKSYFLVPSKPSAICTPLLSNYNKSYFLVPSKQNTEAGHSGHNYNKSYFLVPSKPYVYVHFFTPIITNLIFLSLQNRHFR